MGGLFNGSRMWAAVVNRDGELCALISTVDPHAGLAREPGDTPSVSRTIRCTASTSPIRSTLISWLRRAGGEVDWARSRAESWWGSVVHKWQDRRGSRHQRRHCLRRSRDRKTGEKRAELQLPGRTTRGRRRLRGGRAVAVPAPYLRETCAGLPRRALPPPESCRPYSA